MVEAPGFRRSALRSLAAAALVASLSVIFAADAAAQLAPGAGYVFPPALPIGQTTAVQMGIFDPTDDLQWFVHHPKVQLHKQRYGTTHFSFLSSCSFFFGMG